MMIKNKQLESLYLKFLEGEELSEKELNILEQGLKDDPATKEELRVYRQIWSLFESRNEVDDKQIETHWQKFKSRTFQNKKNRKLFDHAHWLKYAAVLLTGFVLGGLFFTMDFGNEHQSTQIVQVPYGAKSTIQLPDGSEVILNAGSELVYDIRFNKKERNVNLTGEAYFKVSRDKSRPFNVITENMTVSVHGTIFNVKAYPGEKTTEVTLIEGSVGIKLTRPNENIKKEIFLKPNEQLVYKKPENKESKGKLLIAKNIDINLYTAWVNDDIQLKSETLKELAVRLERKYNVNIYIMDKELENKRFTGLLKNEPIEQILKILKLTAHINYKIDNREIWLYNENSQINN